MTLPAEPFELFLSFVRYLLILKSLSVCGHEVCSVYVVPSSCWNTLSLKTTGLPGSASSSPIIKLIWYNWLFLGGGESMKLIYILVTNKRV